MAIKIYGALTAMIWLVVVVLKEKNVPYELIDVDLAAAEHKSPAFLEKQPFGQTPYIVSVHCSILMLKECAHKPQIKYITIR